MVQHKLELAKTCRCCLTSENVTTALFSPALTEIFTAITSLQFKDEDIFPKLICLDCLHQMNNIQKFAEVCKTSFATVVEENLNSEVREIKKEVIEKIREEWVEEMVEEQTVEKRNTEVVAEIKQESIKICISDDENLGQQISENNIHITEYETVTITYYTCEFCHGVFENAKELRKHEQTVHNDRRPKTRICKICQIGFGSLYEFETHKKKWHFNEHSKDLPFSCDLCLESFQQLAQLEKHKSLSHLESKCSSQKNIIQMEVLTKIWCNFCKIKFPSETLLKEHLGSCQQFPGKYFCMFCNKICRTRNQLRRHNILDHTKKKHICKICQKGFNKPEWLKKHLKTKHFGDNLAKKTTKGESSNNLLII